MRIMLPTVAEIARFAVVSLCGSESAAHRVQHVTRAPQAENCGEGCRCACPGDPSQARRSRARRREPSLSTATNAKVAECLDMAIEARQKANAALSRGDQGFWQVMEARWIH